MILNVDKCIAFSSDGNPPTQPTAGRLWDNASDHNGFIVCGFPSTFEDPTAEALVAFPIGTDQFIDELLQGRTVAIERLLDGHGEGRQYC